MSLVCPCCSTLVLALLTGWVPAWDPRQELANGLNMGHAGTSTDLQVGGVAARSPQRRRTYLAGLGSVGVHLDYRRARISPAVADSHPSTSVDSLLMNILAFRLRKPPRTVVTWLSLVALSKLSIGHLQMLTGSASVSRCPSVEIVRRLPSAFFACTRCMTSWFCRHAGDAKSKSSAAASFRM